MESRGSKKKRGREPGQSSRNPASGRTSQTISADACDAFPEGPVVPNFALESGNRYLFRSKNAYDRFNCRFFGRAVAACYYFLPEEDNVKMHLGRVAEIDEWIEHWHWREVVECRYPYSEFITRSNLRVTSYVYGTKIDLTLDNVAEWFGLRNEGVEVYISRDWPDQNLGTSDDYRRWFCPTWAGEALYATLLSSVHRLLFNLINNVLTPKAARKTNMENGTIYFLRHLVSRDESVKFNIPYIFLRHMDRAVQFPQESLPYANLISFVLREKLKIPLDYDAMPELRDMQDMVSLPDNLLLTLTQQSTCITYEGMLIPNPDTPVNQWISHRDASANQYWDPTQPMPAPGGGGAAPETPQLAPVLHPDLMPYLQQQFGKLQIRDIALVGSLEAMQMTITDGFRALGERMDSCETRLQQQHHQIQVLGQVFRLYRDEHQGDSARLGFLETHMTEQRGRVRGISQAMDRFLGKHEMAAEGGQFDN